MLFIKLIQNIFMNYFACSSFLQHFYMNILHSPPTRARARFIYVLKIYKLNVYYIYHTYKMQLLCDTKDVIFHKFLLM